MTQYDKVKQLSTNFFLFAYFFLFSFLSFVFFFFFSLFLSFFFAMFLLPFSSRLRSALIFFLLVDQAQNTN